MNEHSLLASVYLFTDPEPCVKHDCGAPTVFGIEVMDEDNMVMLLPTCLSHFEEFFGRGVTDGLVEEDK